MCNKFTRRNTRGQLLIPQRYQFEYSFRTDNTLDDYTPDRERITTYAVNTAAWPEKPQMQCSQKNKSTYTSFPLADDELPSSTARSAAPELAVTACYQWQVAWTPWY